MGPGTRTTSYRRRPWKPLCTGRRRRQANSASPRSVREVLTQQTRVHSPEPSTNQEAKSKQGDEESDGESDAATLVEGDGTQGSHFHRRNPDDFSDFTDFWGSRRPGTGFGSSLETGGVGLDLPIRSTPSSQGVCRTKSPLLPQGVYRSTLSTQEVCQTYRSTLSARVVLVCQTNSTARDIVDATLMDPGCR